MSEGFARTRAVATLVAVAALAVACGTTDKPAGAPVVIGVVASVTGDIGGLGGDTVQAIELAVSEINVGGGVLGGRQLKLSVADDATTADGAQVAYASLLRAQVPVVIGPLFSGGVSAIGPQIKAGGTLTISPSASSPSLTTLDDAGLFYRTIPADTVQGVVLAQLVKEAARTSLCIVQREDSYGTGLADVVVETLKQTAANVAVTRARFNPTSVDLSKVLDPCDALKDTPGSGIAFITFVSDGAALVDDAGRRGWSPSRHRFFGVDGNYDARLQALVADPAMLEGMIGTVAYAPDPATPEGENLRQFEARFTRRFGHAPVGVAANAYDATYIAALSVEIAGSDRDRAAVATAIGATAAGTGVDPADWPAALAAIRASRTVDFRGTTGNVEFDPGTGDLVPPYYVAVWAFEGGALGRKRIATIPR